MPGEYQDIPERDYKRVIIPCVAAREATDGGFKARAGALTLFYIASPMERQVLLTLLAEVNTGVELQELEPPSEEFLRMGIFEDTYMLEPADPDHPPGEPIDEDTLLRPTAAGREMLPVSEMLEGWLRECPSGPRELGPDVGDVLGPLLWGWSSMMVHALAAGPLTAAEVKAALGVLELELIEDRIELMAEAGLLRELPGAAGEPRFEATRWLRRAVAPLLGAARIEHRHPPGDTAPISALDVEAVFHLTLPLLELPKRLSGSCSFAVELEPGVPGSPAGVTARIEAGRVVSCEVGPEEAADAVASAPIGDWLDTLIERRAKKVQSNGDRKLARRVLHELHMALFG